MQHFYSGALATAHDQYFSHYASDAADRLLIELGHRNLRSGTCTDLGCGGGVVSARLFEAGYDVHGVDYSADFIAIARNRVPSGTFVHGSVFDCEIPASVAVTCTGEVLNYAADGRVGTDALSQLFARVNKALMPEGIFLLDTLGPEVDGGVSPVTKSFGGDHWHMSATTEVDGDMLTRSITLLTNDVLTNDADASVECWDRTEEVHRQKLFAPAVITGLLVHAGFQVEILDDYGGDPFRPGHTGFFCVA